jgi:hypothetical protein
MLKAVVVQNDVETRVELEAHHLIPKYIGVYSAPSFMGEITDPEVCISDDSGDCYMDDIACLKDNCEVVVDYGEIPFDGPNP